MLLEFLRGNNTMEAKRNLSDVFGEEAVTARTCQRWLAKFRLGYFSFIDESRSRRPSNISDEVQRGMIKINLTLTSIKTGFMFGIHQTTALDYI
ncbi:uncharacterized protein TNCV_3682501 [Trichonephila clavipes]|uniref:Mos1 transposase HTH domain-containing protein n=1 Tax=Trichonephila clavipes TaxID=2585209 RepID=A0A8X6V3C3_TRICX|nr:uncharacterized protein TNCV_3682501 [Trichonephila clavipes]